MTLHFEFSEADAQIILNALAARPYGEVANLMIQVFQAKAAQQLQPQPLPAEADAYRPIPSSATE